MFQTCLCLYFLSFWCYFDRLSFPSKNIIASFCMYLEFDHWPNLNSSHAMRIVILVLLNTNERAGISNL